MSRLQADGNNQKPQTATHKLTLQTNIIKHNYYETNIITPRCWYGQPLRRFEAIGRFRS